MYAFWYQESSGTCSCAEAQMPHFNRRISIKVKPLLSALPQLHSNGRSVLCHLVPADGIGLLYTQVMPYDRDDACRIFRMGWKSDRTATDNQIINIKCVCFQHVVGEETVYSGGGGGIRTPGTLARSTVFKTAAFNHSATPPRPCAFFNKVSQNARPIVKFARQICAWTRQ